MTDRSPPNWMGIASQGDVTAEELRDDAQSLADDEAASRREKVSRNLSDALRQLLAQARRLDE